MLKFLKVWWPSLLTLMVVLYATLWPEPVGAKESMLFPGADKLIHAIMMGGLVSAFLFDRRRHGRPLTFKVIIIFGICGVAFSILDEYAQEAMLLGRHFEFLDLLADTGGIIIAMISAPPVINHIFRNKPVTGS